MHPDNAETTISRRCFIVSLAAGSLAGCQTENASVRYRAIAKFEVDNKPFEASTVMEIRYSRVTQSLTGAGGATRLLGEAIIVDLPSGGTFYILPTRHERQGSLSRIWETAFLRTIGITNSIGGLSDSDFEQLRSASGRKPFRMLGLGQLPAFVSFQDESVPNTIFEIEPDQIGRYFPNVQFGGLEIEITDDPVTEKLRKRLPWLNASLQEQKNFFDRDPPGKRRPISERPLGHLITNAHFFGDGSR